MVNEELDILVVGGGITGAGIALDAATRGLRTGIVEAGDWAAGTSAWSSKLVLRRPALPLQPRLQARDRGPHRTRPAAEQDCTPPGARTALPVAPEDARHRARLLRHRHRYVRHPGVPRIPRQQGRSLAASLHQGRHQDRLPRHQGLRLHRRHPVLRRTR